MKHPLEIARTNAGLTLDQLAELSGVNERTIRRAESFEAVSLETQWKLASALGTDPEQLWPPVRVGSTIAGPDGAYRVAAVASDGSFVISPVSFGANEVATAEEIKQRFGVSVAKPSTQAERHGYERLAAASRRKALAIEREHQRAAAKQAEVENAEAEGWSCFAQEMERVR